MVAGRARHSCLPGRLQQFGQPGGEYPPAPLGGPTPTPPFEHFTRAAAKAFGARGISMTAVGPGPMDTPFFYGQETPEAQACHKGAAALSPFSGTWCPSSATWSATAGGSPARRC